MSNSWKPHVKGLFKECMQPDRLERAQRVISEKITLEKVKD